MTNRTTILYGSYLLSCASVVLLTGCTKPSDSLQQKGSTSSTPTRPTPPQLPTAYVESLKTEPTNKGIYIFAPALIQTNTLPDFSTGCARWLFLQVGAAPALSQTPAWYQAEYVRINLGRKDLRITPKEGKDAARILGVTHYALGNTEPGKLTFQIYDRAGTTLGEPIVLTGDEAAITAALPQAANTIRQRLGLPQASLEPPIESPQELALVGRVPLLPGDDLTEADATGLQKLSQKSALAGLLYLSTYSRAMKSPEATTPKAAQLTKLANDNFIVLAEIVRADPSSYSLGRIIPLSKQYPESALLAEARVSTDGVKEAKLISAEAAVRNAPNNPNHWIVLANILGSLGGQERRARTADQITSEKWEKLTDIYGRWLAVARQAVYLDPKSSVAALELAKAATFAGESAEAQKALESAFQLGGGRRGAPLIVSWSLEMNAPKWGGSLELLAKTADRAAKLPIVDIYQTTTIMETLASRGFSKQAAKMAGTILQEAPKRLQENPNLVIVYECQLRAFSLLGRYIEALEATKRFVELRPRDTQAHFLLVEAYQEADKTKEALAEARKIVKAFPNYPRPQSMMAHLLVKQNKFAEAIAPARAAAKMMQSSSAAQSFAGVVLGKSGRYQESIPYFEAAHTMSPANNRFTFNLGQALCLVGRVSEGRQLLQEALARAGDSQLAQSATKLLKEFPEPQKKN